MRDSEGGDRANEPLDVADQQQQSKDEHQVIEAEQDVFDTEDEIGRGDVGPWLAIKDRDRGRVGREAERFWRSVDWLEADDDVG